MLQYRFSRQKKNPNNIEDIFDGSLYRQLSREDGPLNTCRSENISLMINTDGVEGIYQSTKFTLWPVYLQINELPPSQRYTEWQPIKKEVV